MAHKKKAHSKHEHHKDGEKGALKEPMAHAKGKMPLKPMKDHKMKGK